MIIPYDLKLVGRRIGARWLIVIVLEPRLKLTIFIDTEN
jgi:hypothetical protein